MFPPLSFFELGNYFLAPQDLRKIMGETEKPPPASPGRVSHLLLWVSHSLPYVCTIPLLQSLSQSFEKVYNVAVWEVERKIRLPGFKFWFYSLILYKLGQKLLNL